jgi:hypothetical protein
MPIVNPAVSNDAGPALLSLLGSRLLQATAVQDAGTRDAQNYLRKQRSELSEDLNCQSWDWADRYPAGIQAFRRMPMSARNARSSLRAALSAERSIFR